MYKKVVGLLVVVSMAWAGVKRVRVYDKIEPNREPIKTGISPIAKSVSLTILTVDSAVNQYGVLGVLHNPVDVKGDTVLFVERAISDSLTGSGFLLAAWSLDKGQTWTKVRDINHIAGVGDGVARYPTALITPFGPVATYPALTGSGWGYMAALSGSFDDPTVWFGEDGGDHGVFKNISVYVPELGQAFCAAPNQDGGVLYGIYDIQNGYYSTTPTTVAGLKYLIGIDYTPGYVHVLGMGFGYELIDMKYDVSGGSFIPDTVSLGIPAYVLPNNDTLDGVGYWDAAVLGDGTPVFVVGLVSSDTSAPLVKQSEDRAIIFIREDTTLVVYADTISYVYNEQLSIDKSNNAILIGFEKMTTLRDSQYTDTVPWGIYDVAGLISTDGGYTWSAEINFTNTPDVSEQMVQFARSFDYYPDSIGVYFLFATPRGVADSVYDVLYDVYALDGVTSVYYYLATTKAVTEVKEREFRTTFFKLETNIVKDAMVINSDVDINAPVQVVDLSGRVVKSYGSGLRAGRNVLSVAGLNPGVYFVKVKDRTAKLIIRK